MKTLKENLQISRLVKYASNCSKSIYGEFLKRNEYFREIENITVESALKTKIKEIRRVDILDSKKGCKSTTRTSTRISDSIPVSKSLNLSSILFWKSDDNGTTQRDLVILLFIKRSICLSLNQHIDQMTFNNLY
jgi:hypothetical protein